MQNIVKEGLLAVALMACAAIYAVPPGMAQPYVYEEFDRPVVMPGPSFRTYPAPVYGTEYVVPHRPFSLHRFVGNAVAGALGASKHVVFGGPSYYYYGY